MPRPIALLTDFGHTDAYVGIMKGVLLSRCPDARLFDLTHGIPPQAVPVGAFQLAAAAPYCPADTVFLAVVDPGVGSERRPVCLRAGGRLFVGPDNGLLWTGAARLGEPEPFHLDRPEYWLPQPGSTFHGRDIFAPVAAALAAGIPPEAVGSRISDPIRWEVPEARRDGDGVTGEVLFLDHYGNAITNLRPADLGQPAAGSLSFRMGKHRLAGPASHYGAAPAGEPVVVLDSFGFYEVAVNGGSAAVLLGLRPADPVDARPLAG